MAEQVRMYFNVSGVILGFEPLICLPKNGEGVFAGAPISGEITIPPLDVDQIGGRTRHTGQLRKQPNLIWLTVGEFTVKIGGDECNGAMGG